jgi:hypothetical protein
MRMPKSLLIVPALLLIQTETVALAGEVKPVSSAGMNGLCGNAPGTGSLVAHLQASRPGMIALIPDTPDCLDTLPGSLAGKQVIAAPPAAEVRPAPDPETFALLGLGLLLSGGLIRKKMQG